MASSIYTVLLMFFAVSLWPKSSGASEHMHSESGGFPLDGSICNSCSKESQCRSKMCYRGRCANGPQELKACTRNGLRECADCVLNEDCLNGNCRQNLCAINDWVLQKCQRLVQLEQDLRKGSVTSHRTIIDEKELDCLDRYQKQDETGVRISLAEVEAAEYKDRQERFNIEHLRTHDSAIGNPQNRGIVTTDHYEKGDMEGKLPKILIQHDIKEKHISHVGMSVRGLSVVPDFSDELAFDPEFEIDHSWNEEHILQDNTDMFP